MRIKRAVMMLVLVVAVAVLVIPVAGLRVGASASAGGAAAKARVSSNLSPSAAEQQLAVESPAQDTVRDQSSGSISPDLLQALGITRTKAGKDAAQRMVERLKNRQRSRGDFTTQSGQPTILNASSALSDALITTIGGRDNQFDEVTLIADWDGREDCAADREQKVDDFSEAQFEIDFTLLRAAISEHTRANGFAENVYYYGDSVGNFYIATDTNPGVNTSPSGAADTVVAANIPELVNTGATAGGTIALLNPQAGDCTDDQVAVTGIAVNPVADLGDFGLCGTIGEVVYVSILDTEGCQSNSSNQPFRTRIFAFGFRDVAGGVAPVGAIQILRNSLSNIAGVAVDDDGSLYFQLVDLINVANGGAIFKVTETCRTVSAPPVLNPGVTVVFCGATPRVNRVIASIPSGLSGGISLSSAQGTTAAPILSAAGYRLTNYSGPATTFGNVVALDAGPCNVLYAAVARSFVSTDDAGTQITEGAFTNPSALGATPSMVISFADCSGAFDLCTSPASGFAGQLPVADGFADVAANGLTRTSGVNNFRVFALGNGPDIRPAAGQTSAIATSTTLKVDMQIDFTLHSGLAVDENGTVYVISGGTPAGIGKNPSPMVTEVLCFEDQCPMDRRADFVDLRGNGLPNPPASGGVTGDGDSDRFDHIFYQAPIDQVTITPGGLAGLATGFLRYTNRLALPTNPIAAGSTLGVSGGATVQGDDATTGPICFETFDPGHQVAGGDDQNPPFRGDDDNGAGSPPVAGPLSGGFEFVFGASGTPGVNCVNRVWNCFFLNSNGNITFGAGDTDNTATVPEFRLGLPKIAPAWTDLNPASRAADLCTFPVQALGFTGVNAFKIRWINVPEFGSEGCTGFTTAGGTPVRTASTNTFAVTLFDDGTGLDENANQPLNPANPIGNNAVPFDLQEGPTDLRFTLETNSNILVGCPPRTDGTGPFVFEYCRMDLLGTDSNPVITGFSIGGLSPLNPPGLCETNLSEAARRADTGPFGVIPNQGQTATIGCPNCLIGEGTEPTIFELFNEGRGPSIGSGGEITFATPDFDLRFEGNDPALCTPTRQRDQNRGKVGLLGVSCPANPQCLTVTPVGTVAVAPNQPAVGTAAAGSQVNQQGQRIATPTSGIINAICSVQLNFVGCGFFPNETTTVCQGFTNETGLPINRPGKTVSSALAMVCDTDGNGVPDLTIPLGAVTPVNCNLVRGTLSPIGGGLTGTPFPLACCGGLANLTLTTTFTGGDNNIFGPFTRTTTCVIDLGLRAPVVISVTPSNGDCAVAQDLLISGACFILPGGASNVTSVFAVDAATGAVIQATRFVVLNANVIDALFNFGSANAGHTFLIFVSGPNGTSQNLSALPAGAAGCPAGFLGNQQGVQVTFRCNAAPTPGGGGGPQNQASITGCDLTRESDGRFILTITGSNIKEGAAVTVGGKTPKKVQFRDLDSGTNTFKTIRIPKKACSLIPGAVVVTNPQGTASAPFTCNRTCPAN
jgi:hypothetical protein